MPNGAGIPWQTGKKEKETERACIRILHSNNNASMEEVALREKEN